MKFEYVRDVSNVKSAGIDMLNRYGSTIERGFRNCNYLIVLFCLLVSVSGCKKEFPSVEKVEHSGGQDMAASQYDVAEKPVSEILGSTHTKPNYYFGHELQTY